MKPFDSRSAVDPSDTLYFGTTIDRAVDFGHGTATSIGKDDAVFVRYAP